MPDSNPTQHPPENEAPKAWSRRRFLNLSLTGGAALGFLPSALKGQDPIPHHHPLVSADPNDPTPAEPSNPAEPSEPPRLNLSIDNLIRVDPDQKGGLEELSDAELATRVDGITRRPEFPVLQEALGRRVDTLRALGGEMVLPPSTAGTGFTTVNAVFLPFVGSPHPTEGEEFGDGLLSIQDPDAGLNVLFGLDVQLDADGVATKTVAAWVDGAGDPQILEISFDNYLDFNGEIPIKLNGELGVLEVSPIDIAIDLIPDKLKKDNGDFVGVKRAACVIIACLALSKGCGTLAKILVCAKAGAAAGGAWAGTGPGAAACATAATAICSFIIGKICKLILEQAGIDAETICDRIGIPEGC